MRFFIFAFAFFCGVGCLPASDSNSEIVAATSAFMEKEMGVSDSVVSVEKVDGDFARVQVKSQKDKLDPATGFLQKSKNGTWEVMVIGTAFAPEDFQKMGIPESIQPPASSSTDSKKPGNSETGS